MVRCATAAPECAHHHRRPQAHRRHPAPRRRRFRRPPRTQRRLASGRPRPAGGDPRRRRGRAQHAGIRRAGIQGPARLPSEAVQPAAGRWSSRRPTWRPGGAASCASGHSSRTIARLAIAPAFNLPARARRCCQAPRLIADLPPEESGDLLARPDRLAGRLRRPGGGAALHHAGAARRSASTPAPFILRVYAAATFDGWKVMPGRLLPHLLRPSSDVRAISMGEGARYRRRLGDHRRARRAHHPGGQPGRREGPAIARQSALKPRGRQPVLAGTLPRAGRGDPAAGA